MNNQFCHAQQIVPGLWLGNRHTIIGIDDFLNNNKIDIIISAMTDYEYEEYMIETADMDGREWHRLVIDDEAREPINVHFQKISTIIHNALTNKKCVLVHCSAGISRSATLVAAYLIIERQMTAEEAIKFIQARREYINPNDGFRIQLRELENRERIWLRAKSHLNINTNTN